MRDVGAQPERTRLAWRRTILTATVVALLAIRLAFHDGATAAAGLLAAAVALTWLVLCTGGQLRIRTLARARPGAMRPPWPALLTATVLLFAGLAAATVLSLVAPPAATRPARRPPR